LNEYLCLLKDDIFYMPLSTSKFISSYAPFRIFLKHALHFAA